MKYLFNGFTIKLNFVSISNRTIGDRCIEVLMGYTTHLYTLYNYHKKLNLNFFNHKYHML